MLLDSDVVQTLSVVYGRHMTESTGTVDLDRTITDDEVKALVTVETAERIAYLAAKAIDAGELDYAFRLLIALTDETSARTCTAVKTQALSDQISAAARSRVGLVRERAEQPLD
jgi:hypothetical protein